MGSLFLKMLNGTFKIVPMYRNKPDINYLPETGHWQRMVV